MKYWHKRVNLVEFYELNARQQAAAIYDFEHKADEQFYVVSGSGDMWYLEEFMPQDYGRYDGIAALCNTAAIGLILSADRESGVIQCFG